MRAHSSEIAKLIKPLCHRHNTWDVFRDFLELAALSIANAVDLRQFDDREARYMQVVGRYNRDEVAAFPRILATVIDALEAEPADVLGEAFMSMDLGNQWAGQFFTPQSLCDAMAGMIVDDGLRRQIDARGFVTVSDPAIGGGATVIGLCKALLAEKRNYQQVLHVTGCDVDIRSVHMAYIQLSLLNVPAVIVHGNSLSLEEWSHWYTPAHILNGWTYRLRGKPQPAADAGAEAVQQCLQLEMAA